MPKRTLLYVCHNHPTLYPGGAEAYALELFEAMRASRDFEPILLARSGPTVSTPGYAHPGTPFSAVSEDPQQYFFYTDTVDFDWFYLTSRNKEIYTVHFREFLLAHRPDVVHFQHTLYLGYDLIRQTHNTLPTAPIVYTLHEYRPICHRDGQMLRTRHQELCPSASPRRCHECFPDISPQHFFMRKRFIQSHFSLVDLFLAPSKFLCERFIDWGIPAEKIKVEEYGRRLIADYHDSQKRRMRNRIGFFGQFNPYKGINILLKAMGLLAEDEPEIRLWMHGANLEWQSESFQNEFQGLLETTRDTVTFVGAYDHTELPKLMAAIDWVVVPSIWWENSPLVIQEAFAHGRPVICSDIGGMAEKVAHGVDGLHFRAGDPHSLAQTIRQAVHTPGLWDTLRQGIAPVYMMEDHIASLADIYHTLLDHAVVGR